MHRLYFQSELRIVLVKILPNGLHKHQEVAFVSIIKIDRFLECKILVDVIVICCLAILLLLVVQLDQAINQ